MKATLLLENGMMLEGDAIGAAKENIFHLVCNNSMTGYQEWMTNPVYAGQGVVTTYPLMGNYGICEGDEESDQPWISALIVRHIAPRGSNFRCAGTLDDYLKKHDIPGICGIDTRALTRILRNQGTMNAMLIFAESFSVQEALEAIRTTQEQPLALVKQVTTSVQKHIPGDGKKVAILDFGIANSVLAAFKERNCDITVFPATTAAEIILQGGFDGVFLSAGPGSPLSCTSILPEIRSLYKSDLPMFGMGLGHQLIALSAGMQVSKLPYGHRGSSHPVRNTETGRIIITAQNHGYTVERDSIKPEVAEISHVHVNDGTVEGLRYQRANLRSVQYVPEMHAVSYGDENEYDWFLSTMQK
ncbi:MAG: carbamoyl phosphate synthase small subunit [Oscillospiraceae bacterium]|nr:carbamoyl phosphate synthase small subunit [Oscillospiraceae bacterium]